MDIETCVSEAQDLLYKRKGDKLFAKKQREDLPDEEPAEQSIIEV